MLLRERFPSLIIFFRIISLSSHKLRYLGKIISEDGFYEVGTLIITSKKLKLS